IVAAQPQHWKAQEDAPEAGENPRDRQTHPERQAEIGGDQGIRIGADGVERHVAEIEQSGEPDHDVQPPAEHHVGQDLDAEIENVAVVIEEDRYCQPERGGGGDDRVLERGSEVENGLDANDAAPPQTFSISGRPRMPVGRKISTITRTEKAATSLYSIEKYADQNVSISPMSRPPTI